MSLKLVLAAFAGLVAVTGAPVSEKSQVNSTYPLATTPGATPFNRLEPLQQRIAIINSTAMAISWNTYGELRDDEAVVHYGCDPLNLDQSVGSRQTTFDTSRTYSHHAVLTGLKPNTEYHYRVAHTNCFACNTLPTFTFTTPRKPGDRSPYSVAVVGDMGLMGPDGLSDWAPKGVSGALDPDETNTIQSLAQNLDAFDHIIHVGDLAYADYFLKESVNGYFGPDKETPNATSIVEHYELLNEQFYDQLTPLTSVKPYQVAVGNHESNCDNGGVTDKVRNITYTAAICFPGQTNFTAYAEHWNMPGKPGPTQNFWYSYDDGMVHYVILNSETDFGPGLYAPDEVGGKGKQMSGPRGKVGEQIEWLKNDLAKVDRKKTPWVIAFAHRPFYVAMADARCKECKQFFEQALYDGNVDLMINGHNHVYSRSLPIYNNTVDPAGYYNPRAPVYITNGLGGHYDGMDKLDHPLPEGYPFGIEGVYGWSRLTFESATTLKHEYIASRNSSVMDTFYLHKKHAEKECDQDKNKGHGKGNKH